MWRPANNGHGIMKWFLYRDHPTVLERYFWLPNGKLRRFKSYESALKAAAKLNANQD